MIVKILFVDDEAAPLSEFKTAIEEFNKNHAEIEFRLQYADNTEAGHQYLSETRIDVAVFDLRIKGSKLSGGDLATLCAKDFGIPVAILSGHPGDFKPGEPYENLIACFNKGDANPYEQALQWIAKQKRMIEVLRDTKSKIRSLAAQVFYSRVWPRWAEYDSLPNLKQDELVQIVSRQYASHIGEVLGVDGVENLHVHPFENYIIPPIMGSRPNTGDIFRLEDGLWIVVTPQCDMATGSTDTIILAKCETEIPRLKEWNQRISNLEKGNKDDQKKAKEYFLSLVNQAQVSAHFLPPLDGKPMLVSFKKVRVENLQTLKDRLDVRVASMAPPFLANLTQRFGSYVARIGQPNIDINHFQTLE